MKTDKPQKNLSLPANIHIKLIPVGLKTYNVPTIYMECLQFNKRKTAQMARRETPGTIKSQKRRQQWLINIGKEARAH